MCDLEDIRIVIDVFKICYEEGVDINCNISCKTCSNRLYCRDSSVYYDSIDRRDIKRRSIGVV